MSCKINRFPIIENDWIRFHRLRPERLALQWIGNNHFGLVFCKNCNKLYAVIPAGDIKSIRAVSFLKLLNCLRLDAGNYYDFGNRVKALEKFYRAKGDFDWPAPQLDGRMP